MEIKNNNSIQTNINLSMRDILFRKILFEKIVLHNKKMHLTFYGNISLSHSPQTYINYKSTDYTNSN